ncbi:nucleotidyltransferase domain-containing protein [Agromyces mangrovi Wang et al. 2018]|uniref:nucleotidyltransferase domain-containing protein n=1 Tax=Agromyces mangrovi TaxID=1858653 RepID=UPI002572B5A8|nr:nucleotidyltransferase domain-containing protein [Agromyces mangrovi]BDZ63466.1 ArsR family transcriptional regulator [Agromyces mangrovi]
MKNLPAQLTPFVRSDVTGALLAETLGRPDDEFSLAELGRRIGAGGGVVHKEVGRLVDNGVLVDRQSGRNRLVRANQGHPLYSLMRELIQATYGPVPVLRDLLGGLDGVERAYIYGSWAARRQGEPGEYPNDVDVLVVGEPSRRELADLAVRAGEQVGLDVNITRVSAEEWDAASPSPFIATVRSRPLVEVLTEAADG